MQKEFLRVTYGMDRLLWQDPDRDQLDVWGVSLQTGHVSADVRDDVRWETVAWAMLYTMDVDRWVAVGQDPFDVADAHSADAAYYYSHVFDARGEFLADVVEQFKWPPNRALILDDVRVEPPFRRQGYGSLVVAEALLTLATHGTAVLAHPGPTDLGAEGEDDDARFRSETQNTRFLGALGFVPFRDRMWVLDLATQDAVGRLAGGVAHDFNNILMGIVGNLSLAQGMVSPNQTLLASRLLRLDPERAMRQPAAPVNRLLAAVFSLESRLLPRARFPFGLSVIIVAEPDPSATG